MWTVIIEVGQNMFLVNAFAKQFHEKPLQCLPQGISLNINVEIVFSPLATYIEEYYGILFLTCACNSFLFKAATVESSACHVRRLGMRLYPMYVLQPSLWGSQ